MQPRGEAGLPQVRDEQMTYPDQGWGTETGRLWGGVGESKMEFPQGVSGLRGLFQSDYRAWGQNHCGEQRPLGWSRKFLLGLNPGWS